jgi:ABC-type multidrug transport system fused ATPase/permease subunit
MSTQGFIVKAYMKAKIKKMAAADNRMRLMNEILAGIKIVKLYGWEDSFKQRVTTYRDEELVNLKFFGKLQVFMSTMFQSLPMVTGLISFSVYATVGGPNFTPGEITPQRIFVAISLFGLLAKPIGLTAGMMNESASALVSTRRLEKFLLAEEISGSNTEVIRQMPEDPSVPVVEIKDGVFAWVPVSHEVESKAEEKKNAAPEVMDTPIEDEATAKKDSGPTLTDINLELKQGELAAIVGRVGQGKSSLLNAIIGDMYKHQGSVRVYGKMAYVPQQAWILNATIRDNILFGNAFDQARYDLVLMACGLLPDIEMLPAGDMTEIGERGINLSGGQKQRVSLARAAYDDADLYLLDDPLSAVDAHVAQHLWQNLLGPNGFLKYKARILVTHAVQFLGDADRIVVLKDGRVSETGQYHELMDAGQSFYQLIKEYSVNHRCYQRKKHMEVDGNVEESSELETDNSTEDGDEVEPGADAVKSDKGELVAEEKIAEGSVSWSVYIKYVKSASYKYALMVVSLYALVQSIQIGSNIWLKYWVTNSASGNLTLSEYLGIYAAFIVAFVLLSALVTYFAMVLGIVRAARRLHERLLDKVLHLPMSFFDTTPLGRIVNRFSSDILSVDEMIPWNVFHTVMCTFSVLATMIVIALNTPIFLAIVPFLVIIYGFVQAYYVRSSRALKRIDSVTKSPIYQHFSETLIGVTTIRALDAGKRFIAENAAKADVSANAYFAWIVTNRWLQIRLECLGSVIVLAAALFAVLGRDGLNPASAGLALSYAMGVTQDIVWLVSALCDLQK